MTTFFEHQRSSFKKNYLRNLIALASTDGNLDSSELEMITKIGLRRGLKEWQINEILEDKSGHQIFLPESLTNRMSMLFDLMQLVFADNEVTDTEKQFVSDLLISFNLKSVTVGQLVELFKNGTPAPIEWTEFVEDVVADLEIERAKIEASRY
ncbi:MAG: hypothetical protein HC859_04620 [Bacteroidia bacterium]|nr:hypothetical protein [Bacteroidia bacterium]